MKSKGKPSKEEEVGVSDNKPSDIIKPKKQKARVARVLAKKEPQLVEGPKNALIIRGQKTSQTVKDAMSDIALLLKPYNKNFNKKNEVLPFEEPNSMEFLCEKNDCSTFLLGTHSKKRPDNLVLGRMYEGHLLDMYEFGITEFQNIQSFSGSKKKTGSKPLLQFQGDQWESDPKYGRLQNLFVDFFRGPKNDKLAQKRSITSLCSPWTTPLAAVEVRFASVATLPSSCTAGARSPPSICTIWAHTWI